MKSLMTLNFQSYNIEQIKNQFYLIWKRSGKEMHFSLCNMHNINIVFLCTWTVFIKFFRKGLDKFPFLYYTNYAGNRAGAIEYAARRKAQEGENHA